MNKKNSWLFAPIAIVFGAGLSGILFLILFALLFVVYPIFQSPSDGVIITLIILVTFGFHIKANRWIARREELQKPSLKDYVRYCSLLYVSLVVVLWLYPKCTGVIEVDGVSVLNQSCLAGVDGKVTGLLNTALVVLVTAMVVQLGYFLYLRFKQRKK